MCGGVKQVSLKEAARVHIQHDVLWGRRAVCVGASQTSFVPLPPSLPPPFSQRLGLRPATRAHGDVNAGQPVAEWSDGPSPPTNTTHTLCQRKTELQCGGAQSDPTQ